MYVLSVCSVALTLFSTLTMKDFVNQSVYRLRHYSARSWRFLEIDSKAACQSLCQQGGATAMPMRVSLSCVCLQERPGMCEAYK